MILQGAGDDFRSRRRAAIDQHNQRLSLDEVARHSVETLDLIGIATSDGDDFAADQKRARDPNRLIKQATRIVAQVENVALEMLRRNFGRNGLDRLLKLVRDAAVELSDANIPDVIPFDPLAYRADLDDFTGQREIERSRLILARDFQPNHGARHTTHFLHRLGKGQTFDRSAVDLTNDVARQNSGP